MIRSSPLGSDYASLTTTRQADTSRVPTGWWLPMTAVTTRTSSGRYNRIDAVTTKHREYRPTGRACAGPRFRSMPS